MSVFASSVDALTAQLKDKFDLVPVIGFEVECYVLDKNGDLATPADEEWRAFAEQIAGDIKLGAMKEEDGAGQYEFCLSPAKVTNALTQYAALKAHLTEWAERRDYRVTFDPRVQEDQPSSALHVHLHLEDAAEQNIFRKEEEAFSAPLQSSIAGLLELLPSSMLCFAPDENSYQRYREWEKYTPSKIAWGNNNRTTPIRLPASEKPSAQRHIEHRVSAAHADERAVLAAILAGTLHGLSEKPSLPECMFGDARERNYPELENIPRSLEEASAAYLADEKLRSYLQAEARDALNSLTRSHIVSSG